MEAQESVEKGDGVYCKIQTFEPNGSSSQYAKELPPSNVPSVGEIAEVLLTYMALTLNGSHPEYVMEQKQLKHLTQAIHDLIGEKKGWIRPTDKQVIDICILFNDGKLEAEKLADMVASIDFILDRLFENGDVTKPSSKEISPPNQEEG
jgi:hypothetical protein